MTKHSWMLWMAPVAAWTVYMCWLSGYQNGYEQGHTAGWDTARNALMPRAAQFAPAVRPNKLGVVLDPRAEDHYAHAHYTR